MTRNVLKKGARIMKHATKKAQQQQQGPYPSQGAFSWFGQGQQAKQQQQQQGQYAPQQYQNQPPAQYQRPGIFGAIMDGMAHGLGWGMGMRLMDSFLGPRQMEVHHTHEDPSQASQPPPPSQGSESDAQQNPADSGWSWGDDPNQAFRWPGQDDNGQDDGGDGWGGDDGGGWGGDW
ncbi:unnamed protein product [Vitrella brassicaformis CCMP3155]|uniref:Uncharacterized protein n=2 Tax=Vitrella brassicaformis TaxID=1169539 RepID=A0A0G4ERE9_VITBC|nr:unnamed protein product [Vitrella brassicaformis CCMP3155]|mmetsp:Transcript_50957/g.127781  ORF Transcript_50957/g.127781 Transcript_50957/m.127781 type:complete len:176 (+) Transcript_50957:114-641(+)|eukprot:CEL99867.1 unnamed protein product [Vitrella brassicaformis CCMP3155]